MNRIAFLVCSLIGYLLAHFLPEGAWSAYAPMLISYHLYLAFLVFTGEHKAGFSMPVFSTILTHSAFLAIVIGLAVGRHYVPFFALVRIFIPALAPFESKWLFSGGMLKKEAPKETTTSQAVDTVSVATNDVAAIAAASTSETSTTSAVVETEAVRAGDEAEYTADEHTAWIRYLARPRRAFRKPGLSVGDEFKLWQTARAQYKAVLAQNQNPDGGISGQA